MIFPMFSRPSVYFGKRSVTTTFIFPYSCFAADVDAALLDHADRLLDGVQADADVPGQPLFSIFFSFFSFGSLSFWISFSLWATVSPFFTMVSSTCFCSSFGTLSNARA